MLDIGVVGGGINGMCVAWLLAQDGHKVTVYERDLPMSSTSRASSKLLHGGLRYLENLEFRLVKEALIERDAWFERAPHLVKPLQLMIPIYESSRRARWQYALGLGLYNWLGGSRVLSSSQWYKKEVVLRKNPNLNAEGLLGAYSYWDCQMDDHALGLWVVEKAISAGVKLRVHSEVQQLSDNGSLKLCNGEYIQHQRLVNIAGPWAQYLSQSSNIKLKFSLDLVRGSHLILAEECKQAWLLEVVGERRVFFVLPWQGKTLLGTTEVRQGLNDPIQCSNKERDYLLRAYRYYFPMADCDIESDFSGLRPLIKSADNPTEATREYIFQKDGRLITVLGGKWTTSMALARKAKEVIVN